MRILNLRLKNLNSLVGEWKLDFTHPDYEGNGIFAIIGPTGAGKTTLLDAICLALYGKTPRLGKITQSANELMSRQTGECFAEVTFETALGRYRCFWEQHCSQKKPGRKLQEPQREIVDDTTSIVLEKHLSRVESKVEEITGMDFQRFTRSMLLAQGSFDAFLKASPSERAPILEQITGTEIYSQISTNVFERTKLENQKLESLQLERGAIHLLALEDLQKFTLEYADKEKEAAQFLSILQLLQEQKNWRIEMDRMLGQLANLEQKWKQFTQQEALAQSDLKRLELGMKALNFEGDYRDLCHLQTQHEEEQNKLVKCQNELIALDKIWIAIQQTLKMAQEEFNVALTTHQSQQELLKQVRELDRERARKYEQLKILPKTLLQELDAAKKQVITNRQANEKAKTHLVNSKQQVSALLDDYTKLSLGKSTLEWDKERTVLLQKEVALKQLKDSLIRRYEIQKQIKETESSLKEVKEKENCQLVLCQELEMHIETCNRQQLLKSKIHSLADERARLSDNEPCPLCGSLEHPYSHGKMPSLDTVEAELAHYKRQKMAADKEQQQLTKQLIQKETNLQTLNKQLSDYQQKLLNHDISIEEATNQHQECINLLQDFERKYTELLKIGLAKEEAHGKYELELESISKFEQLLASSQAEEERLENLCSERMVLIQSIEGIERERIQLFQEKDPDEIEKHLTLQVEHARERLNTTNEQKVKTQQQKETLEQRIQELLSSLQERDERLKATEELFLKSIQSAGFSDLVSYKQASLSTVERERCSRLKVELERRKAELEGEKKAADKRVEELNQDPKTTETQDKLNEQISLLNHQLTTTQERGILLKTLLSEDANKREKVHALEIKIGLQYKETEIWRKLCSLIGSADGKKFRDFAQKMTLEMMIAHANNQLIKMSDRYLLKQSLTSPLELEVVDNYQAGEERSVKNLSGGEGFIISLALALGLSQMASSKVRVDTLFLDEGFGTLDEKALEVALDTLGELHQQGKVIGLISHVTVLKERISTQIMVQPISGGRSRLDGPGCTSTPFA